MEPDWVARVRHRFRGGRVGDPLRYDASVPSTNDVARAWLEAGGASGLAVLAGEQTAGRGRRGRAWASPPGLGIYLSVGLRAQAPALAHLTFLGAVAAAEALTRAGVPAAIRWPNDVEARGRKIAGVLAETRHDGVASAAVIGVGVNVSHRDGDFPEALAGGATSVWLERAEAADPEAIAGGLLDRLGHWWGSLAAEHGSDPALLRRWRELSPSHEGERVEIDADGERLSGTTRGIDPDGALRVERPDGRIAIVRVGELRRVIRG